MSFRNVDFVYMPVGSYTVLPDDTIYFHAGRCSAAQKERMLREWPSYVKRMHEKHTGTEKLWDSSDIASGREDAPENWEASEAHLEELVFPWLAEKRAKARDNC